MMMDDNDADADDADDEVTMKILFPPVMIRVARSSRAGSAIDFAQTLSAVTLRMMMITLMMMMMMDDDDDDADDNDVEDER